MGIVRHKTEKTAEDVHVRAADDTDLSKFIFASATPKINPRRNKTKPFSQPCDLTRGQVKAKPRQFLNQNSESTQDAGETTMLLFFSREEDCRIDDIARNPTHAGGVPLPAWQDAVNTGAFGEKTAVQLQGRHRRLLTAMRRSSDAADIAFFEANVEARNKNTTEKRDEAQAKKVWKKRTPEEKRKMIDAGDLAFIEACQRSKNKQKI
jgi:hypothetical protein